MKYNLSPLTLFQLRKTRKSNSNNPIKATALIITPDPSIPISTQIQQTTIDYLANPKILKTRYLEMYIGARFKPVCAKENGTYCYGIRDPQFAAVSVFLSLKKQIQLCLELGLKRPKRPLIVTVNNPYVRDNAYFDSKLYAIHLGVGSGVSHGGLTKHIAFDLGVANHEFGHAIVSLQTDGSSLVTCEGAAIHEGVADVLGTLVMDYLGRIWLANKTNKPFTFAQLQNDPRIIGEYALPPFGIRAQKTKKKAPADITHEPHADGLIVGSALADLLVDIASQNGDIEKQIRLFIKIILLALALLAGTEITFIDFLRALIIADNKICAGQNRKSIEKCFGDHGITLNTALVYSCARSPAHACNFFNHKGMVSGMISRLKPTNY